MIKILGSGCKDCEALEQSTRDALAELSVDADIGHVTDYAAIAGYGVMSAPALVVDEQVVLAGRVPTAAQVREVLAPLIPAS